MDWKNNFDKKQIIGLGVTFIIFGFTVIASGLLINLFGV